MGAAEVHPFSFGAVARDTPCFKDGFDLGEEIDFF